MKKLSILFLVLTAFAFAGCSDDDKATLVTNFEGKLAKADSEFKTTDGTAVGTYGYFKSSFKDPSNTLEFSHYYATWGFGGGFTYCNYTDITTPGFGNISAITAKGKNGTTYMTASTGQQTKITLLNSNKYIFKGAWITNSTYAYLAIKEGKDGFNDDTKFKENDYYTLTATGYDAEEKKIGTVTFYLADYRNGKTNIVNTWEWFDFSPISAAEYIVFEMSSTDVNKYGMKTPAYFCMDGITLEEK